MTDVPERDELGDEGSELEAGQEESFEIDVAEPVEPVDTGDEPPDYDDLEDPEAMIAAVHAEAAAHAQQTRLRRQAWFASVPPQLFTFLFANCLFFGGALAAWTRAAPGVQGDPSVYIHGLDTIRGALIFGLALYGFWTAAFNIFGGQMKVWPYLLNALLALWVGIAGFAGSIGSEQWEQAEAHLKSMTSKTIQDDILVRLSVIAPGYWLLTFGGLIVLFVIINGLMQGRSQVRTSGDEGGAGGRRRRR